MVSQSPVPLTLTLSPLGSFKALKLGAPKYSRFPAVYWLAWTYLFCMVTRRLLHWFYLVYFSLLAVGQLNRVTPLRCRKHCLWPMMEMWTCDRPFREAGAHPGPRGASHIWRFPLTLETGGEFGAKRVFITFSFDIRPGWVFFFFRGAGMSGSLPPRGSASLGASKKQKNFSL